MVSGVPDEEILRGRKAEREMDRTILQGQLEHLYKVSPGRKRRNASRLDASRWNHRWRPAPVLPRDGRVKITTVSDPSFDPTRSVSPNWTAFEPEKCFPVSNLYLFVISGFRKNRKAILGEKHIQYVVTSWTFGFVCESASELRVWKAYDNILVTLIISDRGKIHKML